ncbi:MAG: MarR family transcriptional regulator [Anaerolineae bacterium]|nr:MarR family transcriptional regulator [Anaerolineae bacterium]
MTHKPDIDSARQHGLGRLLLSAHRAYADVFIAVLRELGHADDVTMAQINLIANIPASGIRMTALAEQLSMTKQAIGQFVRELEAVGTLERVQDPTDGRASIVRFTPAGLQLMQRSLEAKERVATMYRAQLGEARYAELVAGLELMSARLGVEDQ